jgi:molybdopterin-guanine dinucleotide biosynthesis protein A
VSLAPELRTSVLSEKPSSVRAWIELHRPCYLEFPTEPFDPFININTPSDLLAAETRLASKQLL